MTQIHKAKIIATLGPASSTPEMIAKLYDAGVDVFRLNASHGTHDLHKQNIDSIRALEKMRGRPIAILFDLQGPKLRVGTFADGSVELATGADFILDQKDEPGDINRVRLPHPEIYKALKAGEHLLLDDGKIRLKVESVTSDEIKTRVVVGGVLSNRKGVNVPGTALPISALTKKDREDLVFGLEEGVDWIAISFVQRVEDVCEAKALINKRALLISKLEKPQAIDHLESIVEESDAVMVARGDLGVEMPPEDVPILQKKIIQVCRRKGKPVVVATQMLESMIHSPTPTRAEASDVATAIFEDADAVMLSAESAAGEYPIESVEMMRRVITRVEGDPSYTDRVSNLFRADEASPTHAITLAAKAVACEIGARAIAAFTSSGGTAFRAAQSRPTCPILGITPSLQVSRQLNLVWGVYPLMSEEVNNFAEAVACASHLAEREGFAVKGDQIVLTAGVPFKQSGSTNILRICVIDGA